MFPLCFFLLNPLFRFKVNLEEAISSEDNHVSTGRPFIVCVKWAVN